MNKLFLAILNMSLTASYVIIGIMLVRLLLKKAPKVISYALWAVAGFRLMVPFSFQSAFSLIPFKASPIPQDISAQAVPRINSGISTVDEAVSSILPATTSTANENPLQVWLMVFTVLWIFGILVMVVYSLVSIIRLKRSLSAATLLNGNIYEADNIKTPFVLGLYKPQIYIPTGLSIDEKRYILLHEQTHIRRHDHIVKFISYLILCVHWFNPLAWAAFLLMGADMEMSCDERVLNELGDDIKKTYSMSLVSFASEKRILNGSPLAFGEGGIKERVKNVLKFKKSSRIIIITSVLLVAVLTIGFSMDKASGKDNLSTSQSMKDDELSTTTKDEDTGTIEVDGIHYITLDKVRELAAKGDSLLFEDFEFILQYYGSASLSSTMDYHYMIYSVENDYSLILNSWYSGKPHSVILQKKGKRGIEIRDKDVDAYIKQMDLPPANEEEALNLAEDFSSTLKPVDLEALKMESPLYAKALINSTASISEPYWLFEDTSTNKSYIAVGKNSGKVYHGVPDSNGNVEQWSHSLWFSD